MELFTIEPRLRVIWAHAGMSSGPQAVGALLDRYPNLSVDLAIRNGDVAPGGVLDPGWRAVFLRHPDRFLAGTDTWVTSRWEALPGSVTRGADLPESAAARRRREDRLQERGAVLSLARLRTGASPLGAAPPLRTEGPRRNAAAGNQPAHLPWRVGPACPLARARGRVQARGARAHGPGGAAGPRSGRHEVKPTRRAWTWAALMHRAFAIDVLACPHCGGRLRLIATLARSRRHPEDPRAPGARPLGPSPGPAPPAPGAATP